MERERSAESRQLFVVVVGSACRLAYSHRQWRRWRMCDVVNVLVSSVTSLSNLLVEVCLSTLLPTPTPTHHSTTHLTSLHHSTPPLSLSLSHSTAAMRTDKKKRVRWSDIFFAIPVGNSLSVVLLYTQLRSLAAVCALTLAFSLFLVLTRAWALCRVFFVKFTSSWDVYLCGCPFLRYMRLF